MKPVTGIGGIFFKANDGPAPTGWASSAEEST